MKKKEKKSHQDPVLKQEKPITLVLNGGSDEMDNSTIPVKWFFSKELAEKCPRYLVFVDQNESEFGIHDCGRRFIVKVEDSVEFVQFHRSGLHRLIVLAFVNHAVALEYLKKNSRTSFENWINADLVLKDGKIDGCLSATLVEFVVPKELFAQPPKSKIGLLLFRYLQWPRKNVVDECDTRRQVIFALPKLLVFIPWQVLKMIIFLLYVVYMLVAPPILFLFGRSPIHIIEWWGNIKDSIRCIWDFELDVRAKGSRNKYLYLYRGYSKNKYYSEGKRMFFAPIILLLGVSTLIFALTLLPHLFADDGGRISLLYPDLAFLTFFVSCAVSPRFIKNKEERSAVILSMVFIFLGLVWLLSLIFIIIHGFQGTPSSVGVPFVIISLILLIAIAFICVFAVKGKIEAGKEKKKEIKEIQEEDEQTRYKKYLLLNYTKPEAKVNLKNLPETFEGSEIIKKFRVSFWTLKAKICRPYEN